MCVAVCVVFLVLNVSVVLISLLLCAHGAYFNDFSVACCFVLSVLCVL